nr:hypothetical protein [Tanacetum cinerariifolium]
SSSSSEDTIAEKFYSKPTNNNLRTSSASNTTNMKQEFVKSGDKKEDKKVEEKKRHMSKVKCYNCKKEDKDEHVLLAKDHAWMESSSDSDQEINANMVFIAQMEKVLSDSKKSSSSLEDTIAELEVDHNDYEETAKLINQMIKEFDKKIAKYKKRFEKANQQNKDFKNQNKDLQDKYDILKNQATTFEEKNNELNEQIKVLIEKNDDLLAQTNVLQEQLKVKHVVIDTQIKCQAKYAKLEAERYEYMIRYSAYFDNDKQHRKEVADQEILFDKINLDTFSSVRRPKLNDVIWKKKGLSNTVKDNLSFVHHSNLNKNAKQYSRNNLMACNSSDTHRCSKHMTGNCALLTNFMEKFLVTVLFGNNDFAVIVGYGDVVIGSMMIKRVYYVEGLDMLTGDRSSNLYTIALNEIVSNSSSYLLAKASSLQSWLWHQHLSHLNFSIINNLVKNNLVRGLPKMKLKKDRLCFACEQRKIHRKHHKYKMSFASNKPLYLLYVDLCGSMRVEIINGKRYDDVGKLKAKEDIAMFVGYAKDSAAFRVYNKRTHKIYESVNIFDYLRL